MPKEPLCYRILSQHDRECGGESLKKSASDSIVSSVGKINRDELDPHSLMASTLRPKGIPTDAREMDGYFTPLQNVR
jgi:hypothetical protein